MTGPAVRPDGNEPITVERLVNCARCGGAHNNLTFTPLTQPVSYRYEPPSTHWAPCPANGEPILLGPSSESE